MPVAYISVPPCRQSSVPEVEQDLYQKGWSPSLPPLRWNRDSRVNPDHPSPELVRACLNHLARAELLVCLSGWENCELCRIEHKFAKDNNLVVREAENGQVDIPDGEDFKEKFMILNVKHKYRHCHRTKTKKSW